MRLVGTIDPRAAVELDFQMLLGALLLFEQLQPTISANAVRQVDDQIAFAELQEAVDRPAGLPLRRAGDFRRGGTARPR